MAHLDTAYLDAALRRVRCLQSLAQGKCFRFWQEMHETECINYICKNDIYKDITSDCNFWHPTFAKLAASLKQDLIDRFKDVILQKAQTRNQRRAVKNKMLSGDVLLQQAAAYLRTTDRRSLLSELSASFPLSERFYNDDMMLRFIENKVSSKELVDELSIVFRDLEKFIGWTYESFDTDNKMIPWLRNYGENLNASIQAIRNKIAEKYPNLLDEQSNKNIFLESVYEAARNHREKLLLGIRTDLLEKFGYTYSDNDWSQLLSSSFGTLPSLDSFIFIYVQYFLRNVGQNRRLKSSDAADLIHLFHMGYCDVFRADAETSQMANLLAKAFDIELVPKLSQLSQRIDQFLQS